LLTGIFLSTAPSKISAEFPDGRVNMWLCAVMRFHRIILVFCIFHDATARAHAVTLLEISSDVKAITSNVAEPDVMFLYSLEALVVVNLA